MPDIAFKGTVEDINGWMIIRVPLPASAKLPSRGQVMVKGTINGQAFQAALEPDGMAGHWLHVDKKLRSAVGLSVGDAAELSIEATKDWPEPEIPADVQKGLVDNPKTSALWARVTPLARWEWLRWINSTSNPDTRKKRIEVSASKLLNGLRRPCCFNRSMCCVPQVSKSGVLIGAVTK
jgi:hypothetical protein